MRFDTRKCDLMFGGKNIGKYFGSVTTTQPIFITLDTEMAANTYKEEAQVTEAPLVTLADEEYDGERFTHMGRVKSYLNGSSLDLYYDAKYEDVIITPIPDYASVQPEGMSFACYCTRIGSGRETDNNFTNKLVLGVEEDFSKGRYKLPKGKKLTNAKVRLASYPGMQHAGITQDANTYEEMLDQAINLKRSQRNMYNFLELGTVSEVFEGTDVPHYLLQQISARTFDYKFLGTKDSGTAKLYIPIPF